ncbi:MAG: hypothetical protein PHU25_16125, partial [Deltaproteobacteria bacterium]|nr:hypothetical protein [Deltaproteobacteria bacterium]
GREGHVVSYNVTGSPAEALVSLAAVNAGTAAGPIRLSFVREPIAAGDACATAYDVNEGVLPASDSRDLWDFGPAWPASLCAPAAGSDVWWAVEVPAGQAVSVRETSGADAVVYLARGCPVEECLASSGEPELATWYNGGAAAETVYAVVKGTTEADNASSVDVTVDLDSDVIPGELCSRAIDLGDVSSAASWKGDLGDFGNGFAGVSANGCVAASGNEAWFEATVPAGFWLAVTDASATAVAIHVLSGCSENLCLASAPEQVLWKNGSGAKATVSVAVEAIAAAGPVDLELVAKAEPPTMFGPDAFGYVGATDADVSMCPDLTTTGSKLPLSDEDASLVNLGFAFGFYGEPYEETFVSANGTLSFGAYFSSYKNETFPTGDDVPLVGVFWDDLIPEDGEGVFVRSYIEKGQPRFAVQWKAPPYPGGTTGYDVRAVLEQGTNTIHFCYVDTRSGSPGDDGAQASAGIQGGASVGLGYSSDEPVLTAGRHVWFEAP